MLLTINNKIQFIFLGLLLSFSLIGCSFGAGNNNANQNDSPMDDGNMDSTTPIITAIQPQVNMAYYGEDTCGSSSLTIDVSASDESGELDRVEISYRFVNSTDGVVGNFTDATFSSSGDDKYSITIDIGAEANEVLNNKDGEINYQITAVNTAGGEHVEPENNVFSVLVNKCGDSDLDDGMGDNTSDADNRKGGSSGSISNLTFINFVGSETQIYYNVCTEEPTLLSVETRVEPIEEVSTVTLNYQYTNEHGAYAIKQVEMTQNDDGTYTADVDIEETAFLYLQGSAGQLAYWVEGLDLSSEVSASITSTAEIASCAPIEENGGSLNLPEILYFRGTEEAYAGDSFFLEWGTAKATCGVTLNGVDHETSGISQEFSPANENTLVYQYTLEVLGGNDCANPDMISETIEVQIYENPKVIVTNFAHFTTLGGGADLDYDGGDLDVGIRDKGGERELFAFNDSLLGNYTGEGEPQAKDCHTAALGTEISLDGFNSTSYYCYLTESGNFGYLVVENLTVELNGQVWVLDIIFYTEKLQ